MLAQLPTHPWQIPRLAQQLAELHAAVHACEAPRLTSLKDEIRQWVEGADADAGLKEAVLRRLEPLPDGDNLCHGDFHPDNVIMSARGPMLIDWSCARRGDPLADVARTWLVLCMGEPPPGSNAIARQFIAIARAAWYRLYLRRYRQLHPFADEELTAWKLPIVALRLARDTIPEERRRMMAYIERAVAGQREE
jgi:aminoglycoside phosphotransferase (APT) family kinase protein